jgi:tripartite-type tricarboxylate transporter receptor subunit TctC
LFAAMAGVELNHIPYKTSTHAVIDLNEGRIDMQFGILGTSLALIREGKLRALAVTTERRIEELPDVPTMIESGLPGYDVSLLFAVGHAGRDAERRSWRGSIARSTSSWRRPK